MAEKIYKIQKELEEKRVTRRTQTSSGDGQSQQQQGNQQQQQQTTQGGIATPNPAMNAMAPVGSPVPRPMRPVGPRALTPMQGMRPNQPGGQMCNPDQSSMAPQGNNAFGPNAGGFQPSGPRPTPPPPPYSSSASDSNKMEDSSLNSGANGEITPSGGPNAMTPQSSSLDIKSEIKTEPDVKTEPNDSEDMMMKTDSIKMEVKTEPKEEPMDTSNADSKTNSTGPLVKLEPRSPSPSKGATTPVGGKNLTNAIKVEVKAEKNFVTPTSSGTPASGVASSNATVVTGATTSTAATGTVATVSGAANVSKKERPALFKPDELRQHLVGTYDKLYRQEPEAHPFRMPVDPHTLGIPDYFDIIKKPMDLSTIKKKLDTGCYADPWEYVDDVWLMFDNAWTYNRKTSRVYRYCTKLAEVFEDEIDPVMQSLGFCCGRKYTFNPQVLCCYGKQLCTIPRDAKYFSYEGR